MAKKKTKRSKAKPRRKSQTANVVPPLPAEYRNGALPALPLRNTIIHVAPSDPYQRVPSGIQPSTLTVEKRPDGSEHGTVTDQEVMELMLTEARMRDQFADVACVEILSAMVGDEMTPELCHGLRMRLRKLADDVHALARVGAAHVSHRERSRKRSKHDPLDIVRRVDAKLASGATVLDAFMQVGEQIGVSSKTVHNSYYEHRLQK